MTEWQPLLRHLDVTPLTVDETNAIREAILIEAAQAPTEPRRLASSGMVIGGMLAVAVAAGVVAAGTYRDEAPLAAPVVDAPSVRQLQFATPGGTRIIWQFDPDFSLRETIP